jgi:hypothetical protein
MRRFLYAAAFLASIGSPTIASADTYSWQTVVENVTAARYCGLITLNQFAAAIIGAGQIQFGPNMERVTDENKKQSQDGMAAGQQDALQPGYCQSFDPAVLNAIHMMAIETSGQ